MGRVKDRARYALIPRRPFRLFAEGTLSEQAMLEVCRFFGAVDAAVAAGTFDAEALTDFPAIYGLDPETAQIDAEAWCDGIEQTESRRRAERERMARKRNVAPTSASVAPTSASVAPTSAQREYKTRVNERNISEENLPEENAHTGAAAGGVNAALPCASSTTPNDAAQTSKPNGATPTRDGLDEIGSARQDTQDAFEGLTRTDTQRERDEKAQQADEAAKLRTLPATIMLLRAAGIPATDARYSAFVKAVKEAGASRGWRVVLPLVEKHAEAAKGGGDAMSEIQGTLSEFARC